MTLRRGRAVEAPTLQVHCWGQAYKRADQILATDNELPRRKGRLLRAGMVVDAMLTAAMSLTRSLTGDPYPK